MQTNFTTVKITRKQHKQETSEKTTKQGYKGKTWKRYTNKRNFDGVMK